MAPSKACFDYSNGSTIVQDGVIYYSPNCTRPVIIPSRPVYSDFIPLAPSLIFTPFESLCTMPCIEEVAFSFDGPSGEIQRETHFRMNKYDIQCWFMEEEHIVKVAQAIQLHYGIHGSLPPKPLLFHFDHAHKSHKVAKRMICVAWEWFAIWMGVISYFIVKSASLTPSGKPDNSSPAPDWYNFLQKQHNFSEAWLDGLLISTVCKFDLGTL